MEECLNECLNDEMFMATVEAFSESFWKKTYRGSRLELWTRNFDLNCGGQAKVEAILLTGGRQGKAIALSEYGPLESKQLGKIEFWYFSRNVPSGYGFYIHHEWDDKARKRFDLLLRGEMELDE